jgi:hypothetical protein
VKEDALVASGRHCCLCHKFCGLKIELHHITQAGEGGEDTLANCIPLCLDCHADMRSYDHKHPKGTKYTPAELRRHRDEWYAKVKASPGVGYTSSSREQDAATYRWIVSLLPYEGVMDYVDYHDFGNPFKLDRLNPLDEFVQKSQNPSIEFLDADLEGMRVELVERIRIFAQCVGMNTWPMESRDWQAVPREWEDQQPRRFIEVIKKLNDLSRDVVTAYKALIREARRRLGV